MRWYKKLRVLRCYIFILGWIGVLLLCLSYWKVETDVPLRPPAAGRSEGHQQRSEFMQFPEKSRHRRVRHICNHPERIQLGTEG